MTNSVVIPIKLTLVSGINQFQVAAAQLVYSANGVNVAVLTVAVGRNEDGSIAGLGLQRGQEVHIEADRANITSTSNPAGLIEANANNYLYLASSQFILFRGLVDDYGPGNLSYGQFVLQVRVVSKLAWLAQGTLSSSNILANNFWDTNVQISLGEAEKDPVLIDNQVATSNLWTGLQEALQRVATYQLPADAPQNSVSAAIRALFDTTANVQASTILAAVKGELLTWNSDRTKEEIGAIIFNLNQQLQSEWQYEPFLNRIFTIGEMLQFSIIETGLGIQVVPYTPFFRRTDAYIISPNTYSAISQPLAPYKNFAGVMLVDGGGRDPGPSTVGASPLGVYKMRGHPFGQVQVSQLPGYLGKVAQDVLTGGVGVRAFSAVETPSVADGLINQNAFLGNLLAKYNCWALNYHQRHIQVTCPFFRSDIGPLTAVRVDFPATAEITNILETPAVYGSVQSITISIDATNAFAQTTYDIGFVRSHSQQKNQIDPDIESGNEHPFFGTNYIGGRLDSIEHRTPSAV